MIKKTFEKVRENVYYEKLENGVEVYLYPTDKTKNFYLSISVKYGARINKYKVKINLNLYLAISFYQKIEKRGFYIKYGNEK